MEKLIFVCPVCKGRKVVPSNFYSLNDGATSNKEPEPCQSCNAKGYVIETV